jgi:hypothetical protein
MSHIKVATSVVVMQTVSVIEHAYRTVLSPCTTNWVHSLDKHTTNENQKNCTKCVIRIRP